MPSYRLHVPIAWLRKNVAPPAVMEQAVAVASSITTVEHKDLEVKQGIPRLVLRVTVPDTSRADEDRFAIDLLDAVITGVSEIAEVAPAQAIAVTRKIKGPRFVPIKIDLEA